MVEVTQADKMAKDPTTVNTFLNKIGHIAKGVSPTELDLLLQAKRAQDPTATVVQRYDASYYSNKYLSSHLLNTRLHARRFAPRTHA